MVRDEVDDNDREAEETQEVPEHIVRRIFPVLDEQVAEQDDEGDERIRENE